MDRARRPTLGAWLDPAADKLLLVTTFIVLTLPNIGLVNKIPVWLTILIISRDVGIVLTVAIVSLAIGPRTFMPSLLGKGATALFIVTCVVVMYFNYLGYDVVDCRCLHLGIAGYHAGVWYRLRVQSREDYQPVGRRLRRRKAALASLVRKARLRREGRSPSARGRAAFASLNAEWRFHATLPRLCAAAG